MVTIGEYMGITQGRKDSASNDSASNGLAFHDLEFDDEGRLRVPFAKSFDRLPAYSPSNHAHIIDLSSYKPYEHDEQYGLKLHDAIATMLFKISEDVLEQFLSSTVQTFKILREYDPKQTKMQLIIWREGGQVLVGNYLDYPDKNLLEWDSLFRYVINFDGCWELTEVTFGNYTRRDLKNVWTRSYEQGGIAREITADDDDAKDELAASTAEYILTNECWDTKDGCKWTIKTT